jgi:methionyl-tRNA formyltransferase
MKIVFLGTPDFAVASLKALFENGHKVVGVVTMPDKKSGRGMKLQQSPVKKYAVEKGLHVMQPINLKDTEFQQELRSLGADVQIIVAFRMLPDKVWEMPRYGTFNLHGSLLPDYRGAAPINWAIMNGETQTGVTTFFLEHEIDTGEIIENAVVDIGPNELAGELHDKLMKVGADLVVNTTQKIIDGVVTTRNQKDILNGRQPKLAHKIFKETCQIDWANDVDCLHNHIRGLSPYPAACSTLRFPNKKEIGLKLFRTEKSLVNLESGKILTDGKKELLVGCKNGSLKILEIQLAGKKRMSVQDFLQGINLENARFV